MSTQPPPTPRPPDEMSDEELIDEIVKLGEDEARIAELLEHIQDPKIRQILEEEQRGILKRVRELIDELRRR
jgi:hypothetical protein